jgi:hypothetical protein
MERTKKPGTVRREKKRKILKTPSNELGELRKEINAEKDGNIKRQFVIGIIVSDEFCCWAVENFPLKYLEDSVTKTMASWIDE